MQFVVLLLIFSLPSLQFYLRKLIHGNCFSSHLTSHFVKYHFAHFVKDRHENRCFSLTELDVRGRKENTWETKMVNQDTISFMRKQHQLFIKISEN